MLDKPNPTQTQAASERPLVFYTADGRYRISMPRRGQCLHCGFGYGPADFEIFARTTRFVCGRCHRDNWTIEKLSK
jgi:hypothetical protein